MSQSILDRYSRTEDNAIIIDVTTEKVEDLYNNFDRNAPYIRKDLDDELSDYLVNSVSEIGREDFVIRFRFNQPADPEVISRLRDSILNYFEYKKLLQNRKLARMMRTSAIFLVAGLIILALSLALNEKTASSTSVFMNVIAQGLTIAAWVSLWEALANFLINWTPHLRMRKIHDRIIHASLIFD